MALPRRSVLRKLGAGALFALTGCASDGDRDATTTDASAGQSPTTTERTRTITTTDRARTTTATESTTTELPEPTVTPTRPDFQRAEWKVSFEGEPGPPAYADGHVLVGTDAGALYALEAASGAQEWALVFEQDVRSGPVVAGGTVYWVTGTYGLGGTPTAMGVPVEGGDPWTFPHRAASGSRARLSILGVSEDGVYLGTSDDVLKSTGETLHARACDGSQRWTAGTGDRARGAVSPSGVYVATHDRVDAFGPDGDGRWTFEAVEPKPPALGAGQAYVVAEDPEDTQYLQAIDAETGDHLWRFDRWRAHSTVATDEAVFAGGDPLARLDPATGEPVWTAEREHWLGGRTTQVVGGTLYAGGRTLVAYATADGTEQWTFESGGTDQEVAGVTGGTVLVSGSNRTLHALDSATGRSRWTYEGEHLRPATGDGRAFVTTGESLLAVPV